MIFKLHASDLDGMIDFNMMNHSLLISSARLKLVPIVMIQSLVMKGTSVIVIKMGYLQKKNVINTKNVFMKIMNVKKQNMN